MKNNREKQFGRLWLVTLFLVSGVPVRGQLLLDSLGNAYIGNYNSLSGYKATLNVKGQGWAGIRCVPGIAPAIQIDYPYEYPMSGSVLLKGNSTCSAVNFMEYTLDNVRKFYITGGGVVTAQNFLIPSDSVYKEDINPLTSPMQKVRQLRGVSYRLKESESPNVSLGIDKDTSFLSVSSQGEKEINKEVKIRLRIQHETLRPRIGLIAQEVESVVPEAVYTLIDGKKGISYTSLIGLLIEAIKEQDKKVDTLEIQLRELMKKGEIYKSSSELENDTNAEKAILYQNAPNPFNRETRISYFLPPAVSEANLLVYDLQGKQLKNYKLTGRGKAFQLIAAQELGAGMYIYALIADGREIDQKRMIITQ